ncbi:hypothetical protein PRIPAC_76548 [Pristionchus pacificus]|uniref:Uncharacterized protein n=1 Tax=Pristionchus pacificus TaxID=54126 RepID=A0A2A6BFQ5_PRIPA|nr:hypothetical protein PRIPAC_76548 [Pristionchus pacificus]|eukprot:PDM64745.1 hypothetical protein PRIPAC_53001 [Pristionchus pacificus]
MTCVAPTNDHTYLAKKEHLFPCLQDDSGIPTEQFLNVKACREHQSIVASLKTRDTPRRGDVCPGSGSGDGPGSGSGDGPGWN